MECVLNSRAVNQRGNGVGLAVLHGTVADGSWKTSFSAPGPQPGVRAVMSDTPCACQLLHRAGVAWVGFLRVIRWCPSVPTYASVSTVDFVELPLDGEVEVLRVRQPVVNVIAREKS